MLSCVILFCSFLPDSGSNPFISGSFPAENAPLMANSGNSSDQKEGSALILPICVLALVILGLIILLFVQSNRNKKKVNELVKAKTNELDKKCKKLEDAASAVSRAKTEFLANMSHEIRTPMNSIIGFAELVLDDKLLPRTKEYIDKILENAEGLLHIVNDILDISKVESGKMEFEKIPFNLHEVFSSCRALITPKAMEKGIQVHYYAEPSVGKKPLGDPTRLRQALMNLLINAVKFTNTGIIKLCAAINDKTDDAITVHFTIKDTGIGMTAEQIETIFEPFAQADTGTTRKNSGFGLGLPIAKSIVEKMGGTLIVESSPDKGSKFSFDIVFDTLNVKDEDIPKHKFAFNEFDKPTFDGEVLLCEDNVMNQQVICEHLTRVGLKTAIAENGKIGVDMVNNRILNEKKQFDLILMDIYMPVMDGLEAASKIIELNTGVPIIAMTANIMSDNKDIYNISGMYDCLTKPFTSHELWRCLLKYLTPVNIEPLRDNSDDLLGGNLKPDNMSKSDMNLFRSLQLIFYKQNQIKFDEIIRALDANDITLAHRLAHTLKNNAGQLYLKNLQSAAVNVENQLKDGKNLTTEESLNHLRNELNSVLAQLSKELSTMKDELSDIGTSDSASETGTKQELFETLERLLNNRNPECLGYINLLRSVPGSYELIQKIEDLQFDSALSLLHRLKEK